MDGPRFDALTRFLAARPSRRRLLRGLGGGLAGAVLAGLGGREASAAKGGCKAAGKHCAKPGQCCAGLVCGADGTCQRGLGSGGGGGTCTSSADCGGQSCCGGTCTDPTSDPANCGSCGTDCAALLSIYHGPYGCSGGFCCFELNGSCASNADCCNPRAVCGGKTRGNPIGFCCLPSGSACSGDLDCCSDACGGTCV